MPAEIISKIAEHGITGSLLVAACFVIWRLYMALDVAQKGRAAEVEAVQKLRIEDQKAFQAQYVELIKATTAAITSGTGAAEAQKEAMTELRESLRENTEELRRIATGRRA